MMCSVQQHSNSFFFTCDAIKQLIPGIYVISTPIGDFHDMTLRGIETLRAVDYVCCEDTRVTEKLLKHFNLSRSLLRYDDYTGHKVRPKILKDVLSGSAVGLVSDAGTPLMADPGFKLIQEAVLKKIPIIPVPGVTSITTALSVAALPPYPFTFHGFLPTQKVAQRKMFKNIVHWQTTHVFFERASRLLKTLQNMESVFGCTSQVAVGRELTKKFEEIIRGTLEEVSRSVETLKGECVLMVYRHDVQVDDTPLILFLKEILKKSSVKESAALAATCLKVEKRYAYQTALRLFAQQ